MARHLVRSHRESNCGGTRRALAQLSEGLGGDDGLPRKWENIPEDEDEGDGGGSVPGRHLTSGVDHHQVDAKESRRSFLGRKESTQVMWRRACKKDLSEGCLKGTSFFVKALYG